MTFSRRSGENSFPVGTRIMVNAWYPFAQHHGKRGIVNMVGNFHWVLFDGEIQHQQMKTTEMTRIGTELNTKVDWNSVGWSPHAL